MIVLVCIFAVIALGLAAYGYFYLKRGLTAFGVDVTKRGAKISLLVAALGVGALCLVSGGLGLVVLLYVMLTAGMIRLISWILKKTAKERYLTGYAFWKRWFVSGVAPLVIVALVMGLGYFRLHHVVRTDYTVTTQKPIAPMRVVLIADAHLGVSVDTRELNEICREITAARPDLVVLCGDIVDNATTVEQMEQGFAAFGGIQSTYGTYYVYGNHDRSMELVENAFDTNRLNRAIEEAGITILQDEVVQIRDDFVLVGREDKSGMQKNATKRMSLEQLLNKVDHNDFILTLDHQPCEYEENGTYGTDLLLSGHTHAGQLFPLNWLQQIIPFNDGVYGQYQIDSDTTAIVTSGIAAWSYPVRTAGDSEYVVIDIQGK